MPNNIAYGLSTPQVSVMISMVLKVNPGCLVWPAVVVEAVERLIQPVKTVPITTGVSLYGFHSKVPL